MSNKWWGSEWISLSDMMTGLMLVFLLISVLVIAEIQQKEDNKNRILIEYSNAKEEIYRELRKVFEEKQKEWNMTISEDLTIKFNNTDILFEASSATIRPRFAEILDEFIPKYLSIIGNDKYDKKIETVMIEGHAGGRGCTGYLICLPMSQERANSVLRYILYSKYFTELPVDQRRKFAFILSATGFSNGKNLNTNGDYLFLKWGIRDDDASRRVEFRIITNTDELITTLLDQIKK